jgi:hypothetical protein
MGRLAESFDFQAPRSRVWQLFTDPEQWSRWNTEWEIRDVAGPFDHAGAGYTQVLRILGRERLGDWRVVECERGTWRRVEGTLPLGIPFRGEDRFEDLGWGTRVTLQIEWITPWGAFGRALEAIAAPLLKRQFRQNARRAAALL